MEIQQLAEKLQEEGVAKGKAEAEKIIAEAEKKAEEIKATAQKEADSIVASAKEEAEKLIESGKSSLQSAARDAILKLEQGVTAIMENILEQKTGAALKDEEVLKNLLETLLQSYSEQKGAHNLTVEVPQEIGQTTQDWLKEQLKVEIRKQDKLVGFCVEEQDGGKVEVTKESVCEVLIPYLRGVVKELVTQEK